MEKEKIRIRRAHVTIQNRECNSEVFFNSENMSSYLKNTYSLGTELIYCCWAFEQAPITGKGHIHLFLEFSNNHSLQSISKNFANAHVEKCDGKLSPKDLYDYIRKIDKAESTHKTFHELGDFSIIENKQTKRPRKTVDDVLKDLVNKYDTYEECIANSPALVGRNKEAVCKLLELKQEHKLRELYAEKETAENGENIFLFQRDISLVYVPYGIDIGRHIQLKYGQNVSFVDIRDERKTQYDNYKGTETLVLNVYHINALYKELEHFTSNTTDMLPCRFQNKKNCVHRVIVIIRTSPDEITEYISPRYFNTGVWRLTLKQNELFLSQLNEGKDNEPPISLREVQMDVSSPETSQSTDDYLTIPEGYQLPWEE